jgi:hypothetical protein
MERVLKGLVYLIEGKVDSDKGWKSSMGIVRSPRKTIW